MKPDETLIAAAEKLVGDSPLRNKLNGRIADYREACERDEQKSDERSQAEIKRCEFDLGYIGQKMAGEGQLKRDEDQVQAKAYRDSLPPDKQPPATEAVEVKP